jgi:hypothetical protein
MLGVVIKERPCINNIYAVNCKKSKINVCLIKTMQSEIPTNNLNYRKNDRLAMKHIH